MDTRVLLVLFMLSTCWCCNARDLETANHFTVGRVITSAAQTNNKLLEGEAQYMDDVTKNEKPCTLCEEFATEALNYLSENKTQTEIIGILNKSCFRIPTFKKQCITLMDYYVPLFFLEVSSMQPGEFCRKVDLCEKVVSISQHLVNDKCNLCHQAVTEALMKLKDPHTQLEIIELLMKACGAMKDRVNKCKRQVFKYAPAILVNAEQFLETNDVCKMLRACNPAAISTEQAMLRTGASMVAAS
ncbi:prosaposin-like isoform X1 [Olea europaea var. sylvestris]|uniref:prosaposin-like isoform X1 n=1 Tax=Olea europaea var. sylvestris TaxID=158386 RepID=UPI000C1D34BC|nr:prosaposin-like isoform X1 [Olea europaea var. sylvestris]